MLDLVVRSGEVIDGSGGPRRRADAGVTGDTSAPKRFQARRNR